jgi:hypothetical protein
LHTRRKEGGQRTLTKANVRSRDLHVRERTILTWAFRQTASTSRWQRLVSARGNGSSLFSLRFPAYNEPFGIILLPLRE